VGVSVDAPGTLNAFRKENNVKHLLLSDFPRKNMLKAYDAIVTDDKSPIVGYAKRAYFVIDKNGTLTYMKVMDNPLDLLSADDVLNAIKTAKAA
jgi:peroxiredoxin